MAVSMDLDAIIKDLNKRFAAPLPEFFKRRIIFWYDEDREFEEKLEELALDNAKLVELTGSNVFEVKKLLVADDDSSNFLVYCPISYETPDDNWLLNIALYSEEFRADLISIWMKEVDLPSTPDFRRLIKQYRKYFNAQPRRAAFAKLNQNITKPSQMHMAIMAAICGVTEPHANSILRAVIGGGLDMQANAIYQGLVTYGADKPFWAMMKQATGYGEGEDSAIGKLATHILLTAATRTLRMEYLAGLDSFISSPHQAYCYDFVAEWLHHGDVEAFYTLARTIEDEVRLHQRFEKLPVEALSETEISPCINECILTQLMTEISNQIINVEPITITVEKRRTMAWYDKTACFYDGLLQVAKMQAFFLEHSAGFHTVEPQKVWKEYTDDYYRMDTYYRQYHLAFNKSLTQGNYHLDDLFKQVTEKVEGLYTHWFLGQLASNWSNACADDLAKYGRIMELPQQVDFYQSKVKNAKTHTFVIISDAMRYEVAASLAEQLRRETTSKVTMGSMEGIFPTVTKFGMAALLPHKELTVEERSGGLAVLADGQSTDMGYRDKVLKAANPKSMALQYKNFISMKSSELSTLTTGMEVVYIYHDRIDEASHASDTVVFASCDTAIEEIKGIINKAVSYFNASHIYITSDHGFLYTYSPLSEESKVDKTTPTEHDVEIDRRYLITRKGAEPDFLMPVNFMGGNEDFDAFAPRETVRIKKKGGGLNFVHGGASLQEMVVPLIDYYNIDTQTKVYKRNKDKFDTKPVQIELNCAEHKIGNMIFSLNFYQKEPVSGNREAATYQLYFTDVNGKLISDTARIIADKTSGDITERTFRCSFNLKSLQYKNTDSYYLVIADESGLQMPHREEFQINIAFAVEEFDFFS